MCDILSAVSICEWNQYAEAKSRHDANRVVTGSTVGHNDIFWCPVYACIQLSQEESRGCFY